MKHALSLLAAAMALSLPAAEALAQANVVKVGVTRYDTHSTTTGIQGIGIPPGADAQTGDATTLILVPQQLLALVRAIEAGAAAPASLRVVAVGGASVSPRLIHRAVALGLPVYEGYGLSECGSVVALNRAGAARPGSVGRPLPGVDIQVSDRGELVVSGRGYLGYVGEVPRAADAPVATGDLGHFDADGYLHLDGRSKNLIVTAFGRNVSPEWIERELTVAPAITQAAVFGDGRVSLSAVIASTASDDEIDAAVAAVNAMLPDYARITHWLRAEPSFSAAFRKWVGTPPAAWRRERSQRISA